MDKTSSLCLIKYDSEEEFSKLQCPMRGKLLEINSVYKSVGEEQNIKDLLLDPDNYIAMILPHKKEKDVITDGLVENFDF